MFPQTAHVESLALLAPRARPPKSERGHAMTLGPLMIDVAGTGLSAEDRELLNHPLVGSVILFTRNYADPEQLQELVAQIHGLRSPRLLVPSITRAGSVQRFRQGLRRCRRSAPSVISSILIAPPAWIWRAGTGG